MPAFVRSCANCIFHVGENCKFDPPTPVPKYNQSGYTSEWSKVEDTDWCSHWAADFLIQQQPGPVA